MNLEKAMEILEEQASKITTDVELFQALQLGAACIREKLERESVLSTQKKLVRYMELTVEAESLLYEVYKSNPDAVKQFEENCVDHFINALKEIGETKEETEEQKDEESTD